MLIWLLAELLRILLINFHEILGRADLFGQETA